MLTGFMGAGKTTVASVLAKKLNYRVFETDAIIAERCGLSIPEIFKAHGEDFFRSCETKAIIELQNIKNSVISLGGGAVVKEGNIEQIKKCGIVVYLKVSAKTAFERVRNSDDRPLLNADMSLTRIQTIMEARENKYNEAADIIIITDNKTPDKIADEIITVPRLK